MVGIFALTFTSYGLLVFPHNFYFSVAIWLCILRQHYSLLLFLGLKKYCRSPECCTSCSTLTCFRRTQNLTRAKPDLFSFTFLGIICFLRFINHLWVAPANLNGARKS